MSVKSVQLALKEIGKDGLQVNDEQAEDEPILSVIDAFETPRFVYNEETTKYDRLPMPALLGGIDDKIRQDFKQSSDALGPSRFAESATDAQMLLDASI